VKDYLEIMYNKEMSRTDYPSRFVRYLASRFGFEKDQEILEIGCGMGDFLKAFRSEGFNCRGVDLSDQSVRDLKDVQKCDLSKEKLPYADETFDVVYHKSLIEHLVDPSNLMSETMRVLKQSGKVVILTPDWQTQMQTFYDDYTHVRPYTVSSLKGLLNMHGFNGVYVERFYQLPLVWKYGFLSGVGKLLQVFCSVEMARRMGKVRWMVELMALGVGIKQEKE